MTARPLQLKAKVQLLETLAPGVEAWQTKDMAQFRAFAVHRDGAVVLIDPVNPDAQELQQIHGLGKLQAILLTTPWHERASAELGKTLGVPVYAHPDALKSCEGKSGQPLPAELPLGIEVLDASGACAGQVAYYLPWDGGALVVGDSWHNIPLSRAPLPLRLLFKYVIKLRDGLHLHPPSKARDSQALIQQSRRWLERPVERLIVSHGECLGVGAKPAMLARLEQGV